jgi:dipeptidyl aminopeptidase/acylaminoacyl peptidase
MRIQLWDVATGKELRRWPVPYSSIEALAFSPDGRSLAAGSDDQTVRVWEVGTGKQRYCLRGHQRGVLSVAFSPDGKTLASGSQDQTIALWDTSTGRRIRHLHGHEHPVCALVFSTGLEMGRFQAAGAAPYSLAFSRDGKTLAVIPSDSRGVYLYELASGKHRCSLGSHTDVVLAAAFSPDGQTLASAGHDRVIRLWDLGTGAERHRLGGHHGPIRALALSADGRRLVSGSLDTTLLVWDLARLPAPGRGPAPLEWPALWDELANAEAARAWFAMQALAAAPRRAVRLLGERLRPVGPGEVPEVGRLLKELDHDDFGVREAAQARLAKAGAVVEPALQDALLHGEPSAEVRHRLTGLLRSSHREALPPQVLRASRAVEVLEYLGTPEAREVLARLAGGAPRARLTWEARASLERLARRPRRLP